MKRTITGIVSQDKLDKTITVQVHLHRIHKLYKKAYPMTKKYLAHDPKNEAKIGDQVVIVESRPMSARKRFQLEKIVKKNTINQDSLKIIKNEDKLELNDEVAKQSAPKKKAEEKTK